MQFWELPEGATFESGMFSDPGYRKPFKKVRDEPVEQVYYIPGILGEISRHVNAIRLTDNLPLCFHPQDEVSLLDQQS